MNGILGWLTFGVLLVTFVAIVWYSLETRWLRKETALQTELQLRPLLTITYVDDVNRPLYLENIGSGLARDVQFQETGFPGDGPYVFIRWAAVDYLKAGERRGLRAQVFVRENNQDVLLEDDYEGIGPAAHFSPRVARDAPLFVVIDYGNLVNVRYRTTIANRKGISTITEDIRLGKPSART